MTPRILFSLVLYKHKFRDFQLLLESIENLHKLKSCDHFVELSIYDNTPVEIESFSKLDFERYSYNILYNRCEKNIGFGQANNKNFESLNYSDKDVLIVSNPDIYFDGLDLSKLIVSFSNNSEFSCVSPLIKNNNEVIQYSAKNNPTILSLLLGFLPFLKILKFFYIYDFNHKNKQFNYNIDCIKSTYLSGCFLLIKPHVYRKVGGFSKEFFLHLEDADIVRKCSKYGITCHYPKASVTHLWARGSHKSFTQIYLLIKSIFVYFKLWGLKIL